MKTAAISCCALLALACSSTPETPRDPNTGGSAGSSAGGADAGGVVDTETRTFDADDDRFEYVGRFDFSDPAAPRTSAPAATVAARFRGVALSVHLEDPGIRNSFDVLVDDLPAVVVRPKLDTTEYPIDVELDYGEHLVRVVKRTESSFGISTFLGLTVDGQLLDAPEPAPHTIEVIGDSITAGAGVEGNDENSADCGTWGRLNNARLSFGGVVGRMFGADTYITASSGIGLIRNYEYARLPTMADVYEDLFLEQEDSPEWDRSDFAPDAVLVALGTNDFSLGDGQGTASERERLDPAVYTEAYIAFVERLLGYYPEADIFAVSSNLLSDGWPEADDTFRTDQEEALSAAVAYFNDAGADNVHFVDVFSLSGQGCDSHPNIAQQQYTAGEVADAMADALDWEVVWEPE
jgi:lysophospholipase L1-like esterase